MEKHAEILAPAGGEAQLRAAVLCGADAVYLGLRGFNARAGAENFDENTLPQTVGWCHARGVRVYITLNTLVTDRELPQWLHSLDAVAAAGVDGVLVQDLGLAKIIRQRYPTLPLHASTQMTIHNLAGARLLEEMGFAQVVLARELSKEEIAAICAGTSLRCEVFVHGALCMSVSGQCYLSSVLGERSGNRGRCAQPCRLDFKSHGRGYALSLKDLTLTDRLRELEALGVASFKIEGRLKRPEYGRRRDRLPPVPGRRSARPGNAAVGIQPQRLYRRLLHRPTGPYHVRHPHQGGCRCGRRGAGEALRPNPQ